MADLFTIVFALGGWRSGLSRLGDNSFFWHLQTGRWILDHGIPRRDLYSFSAPGVHWIAQSWLAEALYGLADRGGGVFGVRLLVAATGALITALTYRLVLRLCGDHLTAVGLTLAAIGCSFTLWSARPLFLGLLAFVVLLWIVEVPDSRVGRRPRISIPILMWFWANVHGTFALGFLYLALHLAGRWLDGAPPGKARERFLSQAGLLALALTLVNPYGLDLLTFPIHLLGRGEILRQVIEWRPPRPASVQGIMLAVWILVFVVCLLLGRRRLTWRDIVVSLPFLVLALISLRNIALAPLAGVVVAARVVAPAQPRSTGGTALNRIVAAALLALAALWTLQAAGEPDFDLKGYPVAAMRYLSEQNLLGQRMMTDDRWGGYVILADWPRQKVFVDDRYDMYPLPVLRDAFRFSDADPAWPEILDRWAIDVVVWKSGSAITAKMAADARWESRYHDDVATVFTRRPTPAPPPPPPPPAAPAPASLQAVVDRFAAAQPVPFSIVVEDRSTGERATHLAERQVLSASLYKLYVAAELLRRIGDGTLDRNAAAGDGSGRTAGECIRDMIVVSDNRCGVWGLGVVGYGKLDSSLARQGFSGTSLGSPQRTTAEDVARFLVRTRDQTPGELYDLLKAQQVNDRLSAGLPPGTPLAHKTGDRLHWAHDAGIATLPGRELLIVALSGPWAEPCCDADHPGPAEATAFRSIADLAREVAALS